jgi:predicted ATP-grasp superfamily ATP-dependent carboligase
MKILLVGISVRAMAQSAGGSGYSVVALDAFGDRDLKESTESYSLVRDFQTPYSPEALFQVSREFNYDAVVYTSNLENHPGILARFSEDHRIIGNSSRVVASIRSWAGLFDRLRRAGFPVPETVFTGETVPADSRKRWLVKPVLSGGGHGIHFHTPDPDFPFPREDSDADPEYMLQEYMPGRPCSAAFVANGKECRIIGIAEQLIGIGVFGAYGFRYCGNLLPVHEISDSNSCPVVLGRVRRLTEFLTREYALTGVNGIDFILRNDQVYLTEVNPRYTASMELIEIAYGLPVFDLHLHAVLEGRLPDFDLEAEWKRGMYFGKSYLYAERDVTVPDTGNWLYRGIRDVPASGEMIRKEGPVCTVLTYRPDREETLTELTHHAEMLKEEIYG